MFDGELILWNWESGQSNIVVERIPEVVRVTFNDAGSGIIAIVRPWDEGMMEDLNLSSHTFDSYFEVRSTFFETLESGVSGVDSIAKQIENQKPITAKEINQDKRFPKIPRKPHKLISKHCRIKKWQSRSPIWDVIWLADSQVGIVHDDCHFEVLNTSGDLLKSFSGIGHGCEVIEGKSLYVHVTENIEDSREWHNSNKSILYKFNQAELIASNSFIGSYTFSQDQAGRILGRRDRSGGANNPDVKDCIFTNSEWKYQNLGRYDVFNHYIHIDGAPTLFFIQDDIPNRDPFEDLMARPKKWLCSLSNDNEVTRIWQILKDDGTHASTALECTFAYFLDGDHEAIIVSGKHYNPTPGSFAGFIYRRDINGSSQAWKHSTNASASVIKHVEESNTIVAFFLNGEVLVIDASKGNIINQKILKDNYMPFVVCSCHVKGEDILIGTIDGRVAITNVLELSK